MRSFGFGQDQDQIGQTNINFDSNGILTSKSTSIRTLDDLLNYAQVDRKLWEVERFVVNKWEIGAKDDAGNIVTAPLFQIKAWLIKRYVAEVAQKIVTEMLEEFKRQAPIVRSVKTKQNIDGHLLEVSIFDAHLGKLAWAEESGTDYDLKIATNLFAQATEALLQRAKGFPVSHILFPVGNDFFNIDNAKNMTTNGTPQDCDGRFQKSFVEGRKTIVDAINRLRQVAPVTVIMVSGNHDSERVFYLGDTLQGWLSKTDGVTVDNRPMMRKYFHWGLNLIGLTHGEKEKMKDLPLIMAAEVPELWARTKFREFHLGHWHQLRETISESSGVRVRILPSLSPADAWHKGKGYSQLRAAEAHLWHPKEGNVGSFSFTP